MYHTLHLFYHLQTAQLNHYLFLISHSFFEIIPFGARFPKRPNYFFLDLRLRVCVSDQPAAVADMQRCVRYRCKKPTARSGRFFIVLYIRWAT